MKGSILIIDDDLTLKSALSLRLRKEGYEVTDASDAVGGFEKATTVPFDLIITEIMLPDRSGLDLCRDIRQAGIATPILVLSAQHDTTDKVVALKLGADDYVTKPFKAPELMARVEALLRRCFVRPTQAIYEFGSVRVDVSRSEVTRGGETVHLSSRELQLLRYLLERSGASIPRTELLRSVWGYDGNALTRTIDMHVSSLRNKLEGDPQNPEFILTVSGVGYKFARVAAR
jgi:two-component system, OmpR family, alkaline phosphatase synthesis response regulator PhoP